MIGTFTARVGESVSFRSRHRRAITKESVDYNAIAISKVLINICDNMEHY